MPALPAAVMAGGAIFSMIEPYIPVAIDLLAKAAHGVFGDKKAKVIDIVAGGLKGGVQEIALFKELSDRAKNGQHATPADILGLIETIHSNADKIHEAAVKLGAPEDPKADQPGSTGD